MREKDKRGISAVVTTVLLILISIVAVMLIAGFLIPMIKNNLNEGASCFDLRDYAKIQGSQYSCSDSSKTSLMISRGMDNLSIKGLYVSIQKLGSSTSYTLVNSQTGIQGVNMLNSQSVSIEIPNPGDSRTYIFQIAKGEKASLGVITKNDQVCEMESYTLPAC